jgi:hypothetical protein
MQTSFVRRKHSSALQREKILAAWRRTSLPDRDYATQAGVAVSTLHAWRRQAARQSPKTRPTFVAVPNLLAAVPPGPDYRLHWPGGLSLEVRAGFAPAELAALLQLLPAL